MERATNKNPEVVLLPLLNRQFALDPCRPVFAGYLRRRRTISTWAPGLLPTGIGLNASGLYLAFDSFRVSSTSGLLLTVAVPLVPLRCRRGVVNQLQPRTRHQPENLGNCQRTIVFSLFLYLKSMKFLRLYHLCFQWSAAHPQARDRKRCKSSSESAPSLVDAAFSRRMRRSSAIKPHQKSASTL